MKKQKTNIKNESGRSLVEMVGVLALMGLLTAAAFALIQSGMQTQKFSRTADEIDILATNARALTAEADNFASLPLSTDVYEDDEGVIGEKGNILAGRVLKKSDYEEPTPIGGVYLLVKTDAEGSKFAVMIKGVTDADDCNAMAKRGYSGGKASCMVDASTGLTTLTVTYSE